MNQNDAIIEVVDRLFGGPVDLHEYDNEQQIDDGEEIEV